MADTLRSDDPRLSNARAPLTHGHAIAEVSGLQTALDGKQNVGQGGNPANAAVTGTVEAPIGAVRYYQAHYRNPSATFCPPDAFNVSNACTISW